MPAKTASIRVIASAATVLLVWALSACAATDPAGQASPVPENQADTTVEPAVETDATAASQDETPVEPDANEKDVPLPDGNTVADEQADGATGGSGTNDQAASVELPEGFPAGIGLPVFAPSELMTGVDHGDGMWVLEYVVSTADAAAVTLVIEREIADKGWTIVERVPEGEGYMYELDKANHNLFLAVLPERTNIDNTSLHYTLHRR